MPYRVRNKEVGRMTMACLDAVALVNTLTAELGFDVVKASKPKQENERQYLAMFATFYMACDARHGIAEHVDSTVGAIADLLGLYLDNAATPPGIKEKFRIILEKYDD